MDEREALIVALDEGLMSLIPLNPDEPRLTEAADRLRRMIAAPRRWTEGEWWSDGRPKLSRCEGCNGWGGDSGGPGSWTCSKCGGSGLAPGWRKVTYYEGEVEG